MRRGSLWTNGVALFGSLAATAAEPDAFRSHPPTRPLPAAYDRPLPTGPTRFVDPSLGDDRAEGTRESPWKTLGRAVTTLRPGETLLLRGGTYSERVAATLRGTLERPITIRSAPGELAVIDGGLREFFESPQAAWEPCPDGVAGEFRSTRTYPLPTTNGRGGLVHGNFGDSLVPLHGYRFLGDLRSSNPFWNVEEKVGDADFVSCGPGLWFDPETGRIHARLAHTQLTGLRDDNYRGETDPRRLPLIVARPGDASPLSLHASQHVRLQDLVLRGASGATLEILDSADVELDGLTIYGGSTCLALRDVHGLRMTHTACRGLAAPWTFRGSLKYRSVESRLLSASRWDPFPHDSRDFEIAWCEFTDSVDGVFVGNVRGVRFHRNLLDNVSDDGLFLTAGTGYDGVTPGGDVHVSQNRIARCLTAFAFGVGHGRQRQTAKGRQTGSGVVVSRNVFDFRRPVMYRWPSSAEDVQEIDSPGRVAGDHGGPTWEPMRWYHNTILLREPPFRGLYLGGLAGGLAGGASRSLFNNLVMQSAGAPGFVLPEVRLPIDPAAAQATSKAPADPLAKLLDDALDPGKSRPQRETAPDDAGASTEGPPSGPPLPIDFRADGNLHWSLTEKFDDAPLARFRKSPDFERSRKLHPPGWTAHDRVGDPRFVRFSADWTTPLDLRPQPNGAGIDAGVPIPGDWPDPLRDRDRAAPDVGAVPLGVEAWRVGVRGRMDVFGNAVASNDAPRPSAWAFPDRHERHVPGGKPVLAYCGYPAFDAPLLTFAARRYGATVETLERTWLDPARFADYRVVAIDGSFGRAGIEPAKFGPNDLTHVRTFLEGGGTLLLMRDRTDLFASPEGRRFLATLTGDGVRESEPRPTVRQPRHPWVRQLPVDATPEWLAPERCRLLPTSMGDVLVGTERGSAALYRVPVGRGQLVYVGWSIAASLPDGRAGSTVEREQSYERQMQVLLNLFASVLTDDRAP